MYVEAVVHPELIAIVDGQACARLVPPEDLGTRAWLLAVMAVQINVVHGAIEAVLRVNRTGCDATVHALGATAIVHIAIGEGVDALPAIDPPTTPALCMYIDGEPVRSEPLDGTLDLVPTPRAFGHVYSRWLRDGGHETGYDITPFASVPRGTKHARSASGDAAAGTIVSYAIRLPSSARAPADQR